MELYRSWAIGLAACHGERSRTIERGLRSPFDSAQGDSRKCYIIPLKNSPQLRSPNMLGICCSRFAPLVGEA